jgi:hypothetical protein
MGRQEYTFLQKFIKEKIATHEEPQRKGTPKGDAIGLSLPKFKSVLLCLTNAKIKDQAEILGVSYGVLRKWRWEKNYLVAIKRIYQEFVILFEKHIFEMASKYQQGENWQLSLDEVKDDFRDVDIYNAGLLATIINDLKSTDMDYQTFLLLSIILSFRLAGDGEVSFNKPNTVNDAARTCLTLASAAININQVLGKKDINRIKKEYTK